MRMKENLHSIQILTIEPTATLPEHTNINMWEDYFILGKWAFTIKWLLKVFIFIQSTLLDGPVLLNIYDFDKKKTI